MGHIEIIVYIVIAFIVGYLIGIATPNSMHDSDTAKHTMSRNLFASKDIHEANFHEALKDRDIQNIYIKPICEKHNW